MILKQYYLGCLAHASYLVGDEASGTAIVVDPQRDIQQYLADADKLGLQIRHVFLTHFHADFVAGHLELRDRCGAVIHWARGRRRNTLSLPMRDGDTLEFPGLRLTDARDARPHYRIDLDSGFRPANRTPQNRMRF